MKISERIGKHLRTKRRAMGLTMEEVAKRLGISIAAYSKIETGITDANLPRLDHICTVLELHLSDIIDDERVNVDQVIIKQLTEKVASQQTTIYELQRQLIDVLSEKK